MENNEDLSFLDTPRPVQETAMGELMEYVNILNSIEEDILDCEQHLAEQKDMKRKLEEEVIPQLLDQHGVSEIKLSNGKVVTVGEDLYCRLPEDAGKRQVALAWLRENGGGDKIKSEAVISEATDETCRELSSLGIGFTRSETVHPASLKAWFKELIGLRKGSVAIIRQEDIPAEFGVFVKRTTKLR